MPTSLSCRLRYPQQIGGKTGDNSCQLRFRLFTGFLKGSSNLSVIVPTADLRRTFYRANEHNDKRFVQRWKNSCEGRLSCSKTSVSSPHHEE